MPYSQFRNEIRIQIRQLLPYKIRQKVLLSQPLTDEDYNNWHRILHEKNWITPAWPLEYGGTGWNDTQISIFEEECYLAAAPRIWPMGVKLIGPVIYTFGSEMQKERFLPKIRSGDEFWCQGFSEPNAGSDLASLKTYAKLRGNNYIVNGQKIWTTQAHISDWIFCLVRTSNEGDKRSGITLLLIDMHSHGVSFKGIKSTSTYNSLNEVHFDNVEVPTCNRVGNEGEGWGHTKFILKNERLGLANVGLCKLEYLKLCLLLNHFEKDLTDEHRTSDIRHQLRKLETRINSLDGLNRMYCDFPKARQRQELPSILKVIGSEIQQTIAEIKLKFFAGKSSRITHDNVNYRLMTSEIENEYFEKRKVSIYGGANEIQKDIISKLVGIN